MRIEQIEIRNFRQYRNLSFKFPSIKGQNDLHIIYAKNGVGKTNILNAITWCLYDTEMHLGDKSTSIAILNNQQVQELRIHLPESGSVIGEATVVLLFSSDDCSEKIRFQRVGKFNVTSEAVLPIGTEFSIMHLIDGEWNSIDAEDETSSLVNKNVPEGIHEYIFFDGEHLNVNGAIRFSKLLRDFYPADFSNAPKSSKTLEGIEDYLSITYSADRIRDLQEAAALSLPE